MELKLTLSLPRDAMSMPLARRVCTEAMRVLGVSEDSIHDLEVALAEAVANVLKHADDADDYEISIGINHEVCVVEVVDRGAGPAQAAALAQLGRTEADPDSENGRGIQLMRALVDNVHFISRPEVGTVVHLEKALTWIAGSPIQRLTDGRPPTTGGAWTDPTRPAFFEAPAPD